MKKLVLSYVFLLLGIAPWPSILLASQALDTQSCELKEVPLPDFPGFKSPVFYTGKAFQTSDCKITAVASFKNDISRSGFTLVFRFVNGELDSSYGSNGRISVPVGKWSNQSPFTIDFIQRDSRIIIYGLVSDEILHGGYAYAFTLKHDGSLDPETLANADKFGVARQYFGYPNFKSTGSKVYPAIFKGDFLVYDILFVVPTGSFEPNQTATFELQ